jgi:hemerythrin
MEILEFSWEESMRTGDDLCDAQHKELIHRLNLLLRAMHQARPAQEVDSMLAFLADYAIQHFGHEEECMTRVRCPLADINKKAHAVFLKRFTTFRDELDSKKSTPSLLAVRMLRDLSAWLVEHIRTIDARMLPYMETSSVR